MAPISEVREPRVVVGVHDSAAARWALAWALGEARLRRIPLLIVQVAAMPHNAGAAVGGALPDLLATARAAGLALANRLLEDVAGNALSDVRVSVLPMVGDAGRTLVDLAREGDLLVIGAGAHGFIGRLVRPSVRRYCARHARTTLICVRPPALNSHTESLTGTRQGRVID
ncbi:universal stress protein [Actinomadura scrupuli]|uniref:universal stress protein n=1 Tax=Actinomadura scrupuli TaxID=559629 RepID=UPI003D999536